MALMLSDLCADKSSNHGWDPASQNSTLKTGGPDSPLGVQVTGSASPHMPVTNLSGHECVWGVSWAPRNFSLLPNEDCSLW